MTGKFALSTAIVAVVLTLIVTVGVMNKDGLGALQQSLSATLANSMFRGIDEQILSSLDSLYLEH